MTTPTPPHLDPRVRDALRKGSQSWFHLGAPHAEVVGDQPADGETATRTSADVYVYERPHPPPARSAAACAPAT